MRVSGVSVGRTVVKLPKGVTLSKKSASKLAVLKEHAQLLLDDHELKMLFLWALVSASAALAYLVWTKYEKLRVFAVILFFFSVLQFFVQWAGFYVFVQRLFQ